jgi:hypothetical protein
MGQGNWLLKKEPHRHGTRFGIPHASKQGVGLYMQVEHSGRREYPMRCRNKFGMTSAFLL